MALYHTHRPDNFEEMLGNRDVIQSLSTKIEEESLPRAIMFTGPYGCGKTTMGRILAQEVESFGRDFREIDTGDFRGIDTVRDVRRNMKFLPMEKESKHRVYLFDEVHMLGRGGDSSKNEAQNALLKMLEEVPSHAYIILCTTDPQQVLKGVRDRCTKYQMELLSEKDMVKLIKHVADEEGIKGVLLSNYRELPGVEFEFGEPAASFNGVNLRPYSDLSISLPNLEDGIVIGIISYGENNYLSMVAELPKEMEAKFGAGLINLNTEKPEYVAVAHIEEREKEVSDLSFTMEASGQDPERLDFLINGRKHVIKTTLPRNIE